MKIAYIISMVKRGVPAFTYREIDVLRTHSFEIALFPLSYRDGPYMPKPDWPVFRLRLPDVIAALTAAKLTRPRAYFRLLRTALANRGLREFVVGLTFARRMAIWGAQHVHCHFGDSKLYTGYFCAEWLGLPMTCTLHAYEIHRNPNPQMFKLAAARCSRLVVQSHFNKDLVMRNFGIEEEKLALIRAHGDLAASFIGGDSGRRTRLGRDFKSRPGAQEVRILIVAEFREKKGHEILLKAVRKLGRPELKLWIVGEGPVDVRAVAQRLGLSEQTVFFGMLGHDRLSALYESCDIYVQPSRTAPDGDSEGIPASLMEAMSFAKPVISTKHAGIPELVEEILVEENSVDQLAEAIVRLADDPALRERLGERNRKIIERSFSDGAVLELGELFHSVSGKGAV